MGYENPRDVKRAGAPFSVQSLYDYESGKGPASAYLEWLARKGVSPDYLLRGVEPILLKDRGDAERRFRVIATIAAGRSADDVRAILDLLDEWDGLGGGSVPDGGPDGGD